MREKETMRRKKKKKKGKPEKNGKTLNEEERDVEQD